MNNFFTRINDGLNPILVKETRQTLAKIGYYVIGAVVLLLIMTLGVISARTPGKLAFEIVKIADIIIVAFITLVHAARINQERRGNTELMFNTPMSPFKIVLGKYLSILCFSAFTIALSLPFATACYFMNGVSLIDIVFMIAQVIISALIFASGALFICSIPRNKIYDSIPIVFVALYAAGMAIVLVISVMVMFDNLYNYFEPLGIIVFAAYIAIGFTLTMANLTAPESNRFVPVKIVALATVIIGAMFNFDYDFSPYIIILGTTILPGICIVSPSGFSHRIMEGRSENIFTRVIGFIFVNNTYPAAILAMFTMACGFLNSIQKENFFYLLIFTFPYLAIAVHIKALMIRMGKTCHGGLILVCIGIADIMIRLMLLIFANGSPIEEIFNRPDEILSGTCVAIICAISALTILPGVIVKAKEYCLNGNKTE